MLEFQVANDQQLAKEAGEEKILDVAIGDKVFKAKRPTPGQINVLFSARGTDGTRLIWQIFSEILVPNDPKTPREKRHAEYEDLRKMVFDGVVPPALLFGGDELNGRGILDSIIREFSGYPTQPSEDLSPSPSSGGARSTGRSPGKGSTSSSSA